MKTTHRIVQFLLKLPKFPGRDYLIVKLPKWFLKSPTNNEIVSTRFGFDIALDPLFDQNIENVIYERGVYELGTVELIRRFLEPGDVFVDVGANIGFLSLVGAVSVGQAGKVYAFEAFPKTAKILEKNVKLNNFSNVKILKYAVGNEHSKKITLYPEVGNRGGTSAVNKRSEQGVEVNLSRLGDVFHFDRMDLLKVDVEGFELEVLKGAVEEIKRFNPVIIVEYSSQRENVGKEHELFHWLNDLNIYSFYRLSRGKERKSKLIPVISKTAGLPEHDNLICLPKLK